MDRLLITSIAGWAGTFIGTSVMVPQVLKLLSTKKAGDLSLFMASLYVMSCTSWLIYGIGLQAVQVVVANAVGLSVGIFQVALVVIYNRKGITQPPMRRHGD